MEFLSFMIFVISYILIFPSLRSSIAIDSISLSQTQSIRDGKNGIALVSQDESFELGFFSPGNSEKRYLGIWYKHIPIQTVVWVANRLNPINDSSGILSVNSTGSLVLSQNETVVWHTSPAKQAQNPVAQLLNSGNLVVKNENEENPEAYLWQSFDHPSDTLLPGMKFGWDLRIGLNRYLTAWKSPDDPSPGDFSWQIILNNYPEPFMMKGSEKYYRSGPWNGLHTSGSPELLPNPVFDYKFVTTKDEVYYTYNLKNKSVITRLVLNETNYIRRRYVWIEADRTWKTYTSVPLDYCDNYALCGAHGNCIITNSPVCQCLKGFRPKSEQSWNSMDWSAGCVRDKPLSCDDNKTTDGFIKLEGLKVPEATHTWVDYSMNVEQCSEKCLKNCSCMAYTNTDIRGSGSGCVMWFGNLIDIRQFSAGGQSLYIRMAASELDAINRHKTKLKAIVASTVAAISGMLLVACCYISKVRRSMTEKSKNIELEVAQNNGEDDDLDLPLFALSTIAIATDNFSVKIGEGGFGPVFKGRLENEQEIAVKRLSRSSGQGINEFKNEVKLIAKLQHRNLVKLLGCCIQGQEKMLVYEYMPNKSLDCFIFDQIRGKLLDWPKRFYIICGIARGLLYLHQDSRLRIIHRDLKASNVLLDDKLNPKISDFGMARMFGGDQTEGNTNRVVGTYGYMAPEYAADGFFSVKSDVFSFGILLLEIICGKKNRGYYHPDHSVNLIGHAWRLWKEDRALEMIDTNIENSCIVPEALRCIHVSLLCGQQFPEDRPNMSTVILMLGGEKELAEPKLPGFFPRKDAAEGSSSSGQKEPSSTNEISITLLEPR